jgi:hypothetical protein
MRQWSEQIRWLRIRNRTGTNIGIITQDETSATTHTRNSEPVDGWMIYAQALTAGADRTGRAV